MKKWMRKLCGSSLALVLALSMMLSVTVLAEDQPTLTVTGIPAEAVKIGDTVTLQIQVDGAENYKNLMYNLEGPFGDYGFVEGEIGQDGTATISTTVLETTDASVECGLYVSGEDENGDRVFNLCNKMFTLNIAQPKITIVSGVPEGAVYAATPITVEVKAENLDPNEKYFLSVSGLMDASEGVEIADGQTVEISGKISTFETDDDYFTVSLYRVTGEGEWDCEEVCYVESSHYQTKVKAELTDLKWNPVAEVIAGTAYPFSVTVKNLTDMDLTNLAVEVGASGHVIMGWRPEIAYTLQDGISASGDVAKIANLKAGTTVTIAGTITFPAGAVGDGSYLRAALIEDNEYIGYLAANENEGGNFQIVAAGSGTNQGNGNQGIGTIPGANGQNTGDKKTDGQKTDGQAVSNAVKTGDTAPLMATAAVMLMSVFAIIMAVRKRQVNERL